MLNGINQPHQEEGYCHAISQPPVGRVVVVFDVHLDRIGDIDIERLLLRNNSLKTVHRSIILDVLEGLLDNWFALSIKQLAARGFLGVSFGFP